MAAMISRVFSAAPARLGLSTVAVTIPKCAPMLKLSTGAVPVAIRAPSMATRLVSTHVAGAATPTMQHTYFVPRVLSFPAGRLWGSVSPRVFFATEVNHDRHAELLQHNAYQLRTLLQANTISLPRIENIRADFQEIQKTTGRSALSLEEFGELLNSHAAVDLPKDEVKRYFDVFDSDDDGTVDFQEFIKGLALLRADLTVVSERERVADFLFTVMDVDSSDTLEPDEIKTFVRDHLAPFVLKYEEPELLTSVLAKAYSACGFEPTQSLSRDDFTSLIGRYHTAESINALLTAAKEEQK